MDPAEEGQWLLPADVIVGGVVAGAFEEGTGGGGVERAPKNDRMLFCALISLLLKISINEYFEMQVGRVMEPPRREGRGEGDGCRQMVCAARKMTMEL